MLDKWNVFSKKEFIGILIYDTDTQKFSFDLQNHSEAGLEAYRTLNADKDPDWFKETIFNRVVPSDRIDINELLTKAGMLKYDAWEIVKYVQLCSCNDLIWMSKNKDPEEFYEVHVLGEVIKEKEIERGEK